MKQIELGLWLFSGFTVILLAVGWLDRYSAQYQACSQVWNASLGAASDSPYLQKYVAERLDSPHALHVNDIPCPKLLKPHEKILRAKLSANSKAGQSTDQ